MDEDVAERVERRKKALSNNKSHLFLHVLLPFSLYISILCTSAFALYISACCVNSFDFNVNVDQSNFGNTFKEKYISGCCCSFCYNRFNCPALSVM